jgi:hypothetical protein
VRGVPRKSGTFRPPDIRDGISDLDRLDRLCDRIAKRARTEQPVTRADILEEDGSAADQPIL